jgi:hypothetical protein
MNDDIRPLHPSILEQATMALNGGYVAETAQERDERYANIADVGREVLADFAARFGHGHETDALRELLGCLIVRSWELDDAARLAVGTSTRRIFERTLDSARFNLELAGRTEEPKPDICDAQNPGMGG